MGAAASQCCGRSTPERRICQSHIAIQGYPLLGTLAMAQPCTLRPPIVYVNTVGSEIISRCPVVEASAALGGRCHSPRPSDISVFTGTKCLRDYRLEIPSTHDSTHSYAGTAHLFVRTASLPACEPSRCAGIQN